MFAIFYVIRTLNESWRAALGWNEPRRAIGEGHDEGACWKLIVGSFTRFECVAKWFRRFARGAKIPRASGFVLSWLRSPEGSGKAQMLRLLLLRYSEVFGEEKWKRNFCLRAHINFSFCFPQLCYMRAQRNNNNKSSEGREKWEKEFKVLFSSH